jgi:hypothetical protein
MRERPIIFSTPMVQAILQGWKTQTRRIVKFPRWFLEEYSTFGPVEIQQELECRYGNEAGDLLWVREAWRPSVRGSYLDPGFVDGFEYRADGAFLPGSHDGIKNQLISGRWRPSMHMPRRISRITLKVIEVRCERLQDISEADARAEGIHSNGLHGDDPYHWESEDSGYITARSAFRELWDLINKARGFGWQSNPFVWVIKFKREEYMLDEKAL